MKYRMHADELRHSRKRISNRVSMILSAMVVHENSIIDIALILLLTILAFGVTYHPYFFGDELIAQRLAIHNNYAFLTSYWDANSYKPRLVFNGIDALLAKWQSPRLVYATLVAGCMAWINVMLYCVVRYRFKADRATAWLLIATVLTSRYSMMLYFDYLSGLIELLSTALLLSVLLMAWLAWHQKLNWRFAAAALVMAVLNIFVHERYVVGLLAVGCAIAFAECTGPLAMRRFSVIAWALSLGILPLALFWVANKAVGSLPMSTGTAGQVVTLSTDTIWCILSYCYNVFLGGNYGHEWFWGQYNHLHPVGKIMGWATVTCTVGMTMLIVSGKGVARHNLLLGLSVGVVAVALIMVASLTGSERQEARFMVPVGILVSTTWVVILRGGWRHAAIALILATNITYLALGSHDSIANVYSSRAANSLAGSLLGVMPIGKRGIVVGNSDDSWTIGGGGALDLEPKRTDTFSRVNLRSSIHIEPFLTGRTFEPELYDFGLAFVGFGPHRTARYQLVSIGTAMILAGVSDVDELPTHTLLGKGGTWDRWQWKAKPDRIEETVKLLPGVEGWYALRAADLDGRWLVYSARVVGGDRVPMRLQVNWHTKRSDRFLSSTIKVVYPDETWHSYSTLLNVPPDADVAYVYATLHDGAKGVVELKSVELK